MTATATADKSTAKTVSNGDVGPDGMLKTENNLYQRLAAITGEVAVKATGSNAFNKNQASVSIADIERALGDLCAKHGVVTGYHWNQKPTQEGSLWLADLTVWLVNADNPDDKREETVFDVGNSPSAAVSFAVKRYYRALFHLADDQDEQRSTPTTSSSRREESNGGQAAPTASLTGDQALEITALNVSLPKPYDDKVLAAMVKSGFQAASNALRTAHQRMCGETCTHISKT